jgi:lipopolysaccharide/colanic/teichoic acid biosynthesis glycosyltransferase
MLEFPRMRRVYLLFVKRFFDWLAAILITILLSPILAVVALWIRLDSPGPVLFIQKRLGWKGKIFNLYKFRTMTNRPRTPDREIVGRDPEVTRLGFWLRRFKVDELPQLFNIIKGDMSFIGPRPALTEQLAEYDEVSRKRLDVRPGLSGLAQVHGNIHLTWPERWKYDVQYVERASFLLDISIFFRTLAVVFLGESRFLRKPSEENNG